MSYTVVQKLNQISQGGEFAKEIENQWTNTITSNNAVGHFIAVTANTIAKGASQREITVQLMDLELAPAENIVETGCYERQAAETSVKVTLQDQSGKEVATNVADYPV